MRKNTANQKTGVQMTTVADGSPFLGTVTVYVTVDAGTQTLGGTASGVCTHEGKGYHTYVPTQGETNGDLIAFTYEGTGAITATMHERTTGNLIADIAAAVWAIATSTLSSAGTIGKAIVDLVASIAAVKAKTDNLPSDPADASDVAGAFSTVNSTLATIAGYIDTEVAAIKAKTDNLPSDPADASVIAGLISDLQTHGDANWEGGGGGGSASTSIGNGTGFVPGDTIFIPINTTDLTGVAAAATGLSVKVYKDDDTNGVTTGIVAIIGSGGSYRVQIDTALDSDAVAYYTPGSSFLVEIFAGTAAGASLAKLQADTFFIRTPLSIADFWNYVIGASKTAGTLLKKIAEFCGMGKTSGMTDGSGTAVVRNLEDNANSLTIVADADGNRTNVTIH